MLTIIMIYVIFKKYLMFYKMEMDKLVLITFMKFYYDLL